MENFKYDISVIIPVYNVNSYLRETLNSVFSQTKDKIEIILIDDGSTDGSEKICDEFSKFDNVSVIHKSNEGQGKARNLGLKMASGKYIYFLDSDDYIENETLEYLYEIAESNKLDIVCFSATVFYENEEFTNTFKYNDDLGFKLSEFITEVHDGIETFAYLNKHNEYLTSAPRRFFRSDFLKKNNLFFPEGIIHEDEIFGFKTMVLSDRIMCIPNRFYHRRVRANSTMTNRNIIPSIKGYMYSWNDINEFIKKCNWKKEEKNIAYKFCGNLLSTAFNMYSLSNREDRKIADRILNLYYNCMINSLDNYNFSIYLFLKYKKLYLLFYRVYKKISSFK